MKAGPSMSMILLATLFLCQVQPGYQFTPHLDLRSVFQLMYAIAAHASRSPADVISLRPPKPAIGFQVTPFHRSPSGSTGQRTAPARLTEVPLSLQLLVGAPSHPRSQGSRQ